MINNLNCKIWKNFLSKEMKLNYMTSLISFLEQEKNNSKEIYPINENIFRCFKETNFKDIKCCIIGQDPYHTTNKAMGLSFSIPKSEKLTPSLRNIQTELFNDLGIEKSNHGDLTSWAKNGVLLMNTVLTVEKGKANSHKNKGWETLTDKIISKINSDLTNIVFILWGKEAQKKLDLINTEKHLVIASSHPTHFSARKGFFGSKCFSKTNNYLESNNKEKIDWMQK